MKEDNLITCIENLTRRINSSEEKVNKMLKEVKEMKRSETVQDIFEKIMDSQSLYCIN